MSMAPFIVQLDLGLKEKLEAGLQRLGFSLSQPPYTFFQGKKKGVTCTLYTSGKLVVQGKDKQEFIEFFLEPEILGDFSYGYEKEKLDLTPRIGVDESGKGDFFGPLCIAGVYGNEKTIVTLAEMGVKDSKKMTDSSIVKMAEKIRKECLHSVVRIGPKRYNELYDKFGNLNLLLGWGHATVIENLLEKTDCKQVIIDKFAAEYVVETALKRKKKHVVLVQKTQGESDIVVAGASILARAAFLEGLEQLKTNWKCEFPKGASQKTISFGKKLIKDHGNAILLEVGKMHFKTSQMILDA